MRASSASVLAFVCSLVYFLETTAAASLTQTSRTVGQQTSTSTVSPSNPISEALPSTTISPNPTQTATSVQLSVATSIVNKPFPSIPVPANINGGSPVSASVDLACANCSTFGSLGFTGGNFSFNNESITGGIFEMEANGFGGIFEVNITASAELKFSFDHTLFSFPVIGLGLPSIGSSKVQAGILLEVAGVFDIELDESMEFTLGGSFSIPDGSAITFDASNPSNSSQHGFTQSTGLQVSPVPFQANLSSPTLTASVAIQPKLTFGVHAMDIIYAEAGIFFDLPKVTVEVEGVTNVDGNCNAINTTNNAGAVSGNFTNVIPTAEVDVGLLADAAAFQVQGSASTVLANATFPLPTACLMFDSSAHALTTATTQPNGSSGSGANGSSAKGSAASSSDVHVWNVMWGLGFSLLLGMIAL